MYLFSYLVARLSPENMQTTCRAGSRLNAIIRLYHTKAAAVHGAVFKHTVHAVFLLTGA